MKPLVDIGFLRHRLTVEQASDVADGGGGFTTTWTTVATRWGSIQPLSGREAFEAQQVQGRLTHKIRMRWLTGLTTSMRISFSSRLFNIRSIQDEQEHKVVQTLLCEEGAGS